MGALFNLMHEATGCDNCGRFVPTAAEEAAEMVEMEADLRARIASLESQLREREAECRTMVEKYEATKAVTISGIAEHIADDVLLSRAVAAEAALAAAREEWDRDVGRLCFVIGSYMHAPPAFRGEALRDMAATVETVQSGELANYGWPAAYARSEKQLAELRSTLAAAESARSALSDALAVSREENERLRMIAAAACEVCSHVDGCDGLAVCAGFELADRRTP